ncbi:MAG: hypothetical protein ACRECY_08240 [Phyllobacterium sp.]
MSGYPCLPDISILSDMIWHPQGRIVQRLALLGEDQVCTSIIAASEPR